MRARVQSGVRPTSSPADISPTVFSTRVRRTWWHWWQHFANEALHRGHAIGASPVALACRAGPILVQPADCGLERATAFPRPSTGALDSLRTRGITNFLTVKDFSDGPQSLKPISSSISSRLAETLLGPSVFEGPSYLVVLKSRQRVPFEGQARTGRGRPWLSEADLGFFTEATKSGGSFLGRARR